MQIDKAAEELKVSHSEYRIKGALIVLESLVDIWGYDDLTISEALEVLRKGSENYTKMNE